MKPTNGTSRLFFVPFAVMVLTFVTFVTAQQVFRSAVTLVTIDVTVLDNDGRPVPGLTAEDFEVKLDGKVQPVRAVAYVRASGTQRPAPSAAGAPPAAQPPAGTRDAEPRVFVLLADDLSFAPSRGRKLLAAAQRFVKALPSTDLVGFTTTSGVQTVNPTPDRLAVSTGLGKVVGEFVDPRTPMPGQPIVGIIEALEIIEHGDTTRLKQVVARECFGGSSAAVDAQSIEVLMRDNDCAADVRSVARRVSSYTRVVRDRQIDRFTGVITSLRGLPGIKHLVILSDGLGLVRDFGDLLPVARAASAAGVQLSVMVEEPDRIDLTDAGREEATLRVDVGAASQRAADGQALLSGMQNVADMTGGGFYRVIGNADPSFERVAIASSAVYRLGVEPLNDTAPGRQFAVTASVKRTGLTVMANRHAVAPDPNSPPTNPVATPVRPLSTEEQLRLAIGGRELHRDVPIRIGTARRRDSAGGEIGVAVDIQIPARVAGPLTAMFGTIDAAGAVRGGRLDLAPPAGGGDYRAMLILPIPAGTERLRIAAADASGAIGSVEATVTPTLDVIGPFTVSDLLTSWVDAERRSQFIAIDELPAGAQVLQAALELYPPAGVPAATDVSVILSLTSADPSRPVVEQDVPAAPVDGRLRAAAEFSVADLPAGTYTLRAAVFIDGKAVGTKRTAITKK